MYKNLVRLERFAAVVSKFFLSQGEKSFYVSSTVFYRMSMSEQGQCWVVFLNCHKLRSCIKDVRRVILTTLPTQQIKSWKQERKKNKNFTTNVTSLAWDLWLTKISIHISDFCSVVCDGREVVEVWNKGKVGNIKSSLTTMGTACWGLASRGLSRLALPKLCHLLTDRRQHQRSPLAIIRSFLDFSSPHTPAFTPGL